MTKNTIENNAGRHKIRKIFPTNCLVLLITFVSTTVHSLAIAQITANLMVKTLQLTVPW